MKINVSIILQRIWNKDSSISVQFPCLNKNHETIQIISRNTTFYQNENLSIIKFHMKMLLKIAVKIMYNI